MLTGEKTRQAIVRPGSRGDTLVEVLIAMVLFLFIFMAVLSTALLAIDSNTGNMLRNEAVRIAAQSMSGARNWSFDNLANLPGQGAAPITINRNFRNFTEPFTVTNTPVSEDSNDYLITVAVNWKWRGQPHAYTITSVISRQ